MNWSTAEERDFAKLTDAGLERLPAIRLYRRHGGDMKRAIAAVLRHVTTQEAGKTQSGDEKPSAGSPIASEAALEPLS